jgi:hypothetical protein
MFHALARLCADALVGRGADRSTGAWRQVHQALDHGFAKSARGQASNLGFPADVVDFGDVLIAMQEERHRADYDPHASYSRAEVETLILSAERAIASLNAASRRDKRAFAVLVLLRRR